MGYGYWKPYVPVAKRRAQAEKAVTKAKKAGLAMQPVVIDGRTIARTFWGKAWCENLEAYSDYENRLPRGRAYVRNGAVIDLVIEPGVIKAQVMGSRLYKVEIAIAAVPDAHWKKLVQACTGSIASLVELLQGRLAKAVMERLCEPKTGLFPAPKDIRFACSCPDWATMCKHVAAVLYGVGARLDEKPELLFVLRKVDANDLTTAQAATLPAQAKKPAKAKVLDSAALAEVFDIELTTTVEASAREMPSKPPSRRTGGQRTATPAKTVKAAKESASKAPPGHAAKKKPAPKKASSC